MVKHADLELDILKLPLVEFIKVKGLQIRHYNRDKDMKELINVFNTIWKESQGPEITMTEAIASQLPEDHVILAEFNRKIVGFVIFDLIVEGGEKKGIFRFIGVQKEHRGKKIASAIAFRAGEQLLRYGVTKIKSFIPDKNQKALDFINFFGFEKKEETEYKPEFPK